VLIGQFDRDAQLHELLQRATGPGERREQTDRAKAKPGIRIDFEGECDANSAQETEDLILPNAGWRARGYALFVKCRARD
jgi:hypothetical protein